MYVLYCILRSALWNSALQGCAPYLQNGEEGAVTNCMHYNLNLARGLSAKHLHRMQVCLLHAKAKAKEGKANNAVLTQDCNIVHWSH